MAGHALDWLAARALGRRNIGICAIVLVCAKGALFRATLGKLSRSASSARDLAVRGLVVASITIDAPAAARRRLVCATWANIALCTTQRCREAPRLAPKASAPPFQRLVITDGAFNAAGAACRRLVTSTQARVTQGASGMTGEVAHSASSAFAADVCGASGAATPTAGQWHSVAGAGGVEDKASATKWCTTQTNVDLVRTDQFNQRGPNDNRVDAVRLADDFHPLGSGGIECGVANTCQRGREGARVSRARESVRDRQPVAVTRRERHAELGVHNG
mmetsp:Transcript_9168/g.23451  ORF Transcript_9168/g.23451 Transcript_9168/m.23451 type:complete len:276 (+) Transcript_9168:859-1686(+)